MKIIHSPFSHSRDSAHVFSRKAEALQRSLLSVERSKTRQHNSSDLKSSQQLGVLPSLNGTEHFNLDIVHEFNKDVINPMNSSLTLFTTTFPNLTIPPFSGQGLGDEIMLKKVICGISYQNLDKLLMSSIIKGSYSNVTFASSSQGQKLKERIELACDQSTIDINFHAHKFKGEVLHAIVRLIGDFAIIIKRKGNVDGVVYYSRIFLDDRLSCCSVPLSQSGNNFREFSKILSRA